MVSRFNIQKVAFVESFYGQVDAGFEKAMKSLWTILTSVNVVILVFECLCILSKWSKYIIIHIHIYLYILHHIYIIIYIWYYIYVISTSSYIHISKTPSIQHPGRPSISPRSPWNRKSLWSTRSTYRRFRQVWEMQKMEPGWTIQITYIYIYIIIYMYIYIYYNIIYTYADIHVFLIYKYQDYGHTTDISGYITSINEYGATYHHGSIWPIFAYQRHPETLNLHGSGGNDRILSSSWRSTVNSFAISQHFSIPNRFKPSTA
jgi:hypothetical protein